jgi:hypothetical protein
VIEGPYLKCLAELSGQICSLVALYPVENVINRLIVQGTRTIIDNTDNGVGVIPINTRYDGFWDCVQAISDVEGFGGFYKGIGALIMETVAMCLLLKAAKTVAIRICKGLLNLKSRGFKGLRFKHRLLFCSNLRFCIKMALFYFDCKSNAVGKTESYAYKI